MKDILWARLCGSVAEPSLVYAGPLHCIAFLRLPGTLCKQET